jgi:hypothetical protein
VEITRFIYMRLMEFESTSKFHRGSRLVFRSILFIANKMKDLCLKEPEPREITRLDTDRFQPMLV